MQLVLLGEKGKLLSSPQQVVIGDNKDTTSTKSPNTMVDQDYPHRTLQNKGIVDSGCSRHITGNKAYLAEYQDFNGGPVAFGGSKGYITGKGKSWKRFNLQRFFKMITLVLLVKKEATQGSRIKQQTSGPQEANHNAGTQDNIDAGDSEKEDESAQGLLCTAYMVFLFLNSKRTDSKGLVSTVIPYDDYPSPGSNQSVTNDDSENTTHETLIKKNPTDGIFTNFNLMMIRVVLADFNKFRTCLNDIPQSTSRINSIHPSTLILGDPQSAVQTRNILRLIEDESWVEHVEELLQFKLQKVSKFIKKLPYGKKVIGTKWIYRNKKDERGVVVRNKARLVAQGHRQEEGIDYDEVFAPVARIEAIRIFLAFASYMGFIVYQMDMKSAFLYGKTDEEHGYRRGTIDKTLFIKKDKHDIILVQVYVDDIIFGSTKKSWCDEFEALMKKILKKFEFVSVKIASTPIETQKPLVKDEEASDVDVHLYRSMIGSLMYLTASRPNIMFCSHVSKCANPKLGLWYPRVSSFDLEAYSDSDYAGANLDRKSTTGGCQFLGGRLISCQCKKQTIVATFTTEAEYVATVNCCGQVLWIQNQMLDYGFIFMNTKIYIDNKSTICIVKNPVFHSKTKHIAIRHHFIRDAYEKKLIQVLKIHTDDNVADLLTKAFDVNSYLGFKESLERDIDGTEELLLPDLFILWLTKVSTDSAKLIPLGKDSTAIKTLEKIPPRV
ncbi:putative ribonuclease H-like domain-containing protein [Tanacetum coccineum]